MGELAPDPVEECGSVSCRERGEVLARRVGESDPIGHLRDPIRPVRRSWSASPRVSSIFFRAPGRGRPGRRRSMRPSNAGWPSASGATDVSLPSNLRRHSGGFSILRNQPACSRRQLGRNPLQGLARARRPARRRRGTHLALSQAASRSRWLRARRPVTRRRIRPKPTDELETVTLQLPAPSLRVVREVPRGSRRTYVRSPFSETRASRSLCPPGPLAPW